MEDNREWEELSPEEKLLAIDSYLKGMTKLDDNDKEANKTRLEWIREHLPAYKPDCGKNFIFVSYSHRDYEKVYSDLAYFSYNSHTRVRFWYDEGLPIGKDWEKAAQKVMEKPNCVGVVFYLSKNLLLSGSVFKEIDTATKLGKRSFAIALDPDQYSAAKIFDEAKGKELRAIQDKQKLLEEFFPQAHTALIMGKDNVQARINKISEEFGVTEEVFSDFVCEEVEGGLRLKEYRGNKTQIYIPSYIEDKPVIELSADFKNAVKVYVPKTVKFINADKLENAYNLEEIKVDPENSTYYDLNGVLCKKGDGNSICRAPINWNWINQFEKFESLNAEDNLYKAAEQLFMWLFNDVVIRYRGIPEKECLDTYEMSMFDVATLYKNIIQDNLSFEHYTKILKSPKERYKLYIKAKESSIFKDIRSIENAAFAKCRNITNLFLPNAIEDIGTSAFAESNISLILLSENTTVLNAYAFYKCKELKTLLTDKNISENDSVIWLKGKAFLYGNIKIVGQSAFEETAIEHVFLNEYVEGIGKSAFDNCGNLLDIIIPGTVNYVYEQTFSQCLRLKNIEISHGTTHICSYSFYNCISLKTITIPLTMRAIDVKAFMGCTALQLINFMGIKAEWERIKWFDDDSEISSPLIIINQLAGAVPPAFVRCTDGVIQVIFRKN